MPELEMGGYGAGMMDRDLTDIGPDLDLGQEGGMGPDMDLGQDGKELIDASPVERIRNVAQNAGPDLAEDGEDMGPAVLGRTPMLGKLRRENDLPVLRDKVSEMMG